MNATEPQTLNELLRLAERLRPQIVRLANGIRWCWIAEWRSDNQKYEFGVKVEGQTTWQQFGTLSRPHHEWIVSLNQLEGISPEAHLAIWMSGDQQAKACLSEDESDVVLMLRGTIHHHEASTGCYVFTLEGDKATDLFSCLSSILDCKQAIPTTKATSAQARFTMIEHEDCTFHVSGRYEPDPLDVGCFDITITLQSAADLYSQIMFLHR